MYYEFRQNNSGGHFEENENVGQLVIIEASDPTEAYEKADNIGIYYDGVEKGIDCDCCGDRWSAWLSTVELPTDHYIYIYSYVDKEAILKKLAEMGISEVEYLEEKNKLKFKIDTIEQYAEVYTLDNVFDSDYACILYTNDGKKIYPSNRSKSK